MPIPNTNATLYRVGCGHFGLGSFWTRWGHHGQSEKLTSKYYTGQFQRNGENVILGVYCKFGNII